MRSLYPLLAALIPLVYGKATIDAQIAALESSNSPLLQYPTQLTQNLVPKQIHSHNDCMFLRPAAYQSVKLMLFGRLEGRTLVIRIEFWSAECGGRCLVD